MSPLEVSWQLLVSLLLNGLILGLIYALMGVGVTLIVGIMGLSNFAHGEFYMIGAYTIYYVASLLGIPSVLSIPFGALSGFLTGFAVEKLIIRDTYTKKLERPYEMAMLGTFTISIILSNLAREIFGPFIRSPPPFYPGSIDILFFVRIGLDRVIALVLSALTLLTLHIFIKKTRTGRSWRAVAQNRIGAIFSGISIGKTCSLAFSASGALAALAGALLSPVYGVYPHMGFAPLCISFVIVVIGGLGSIEGSLIGAIIVGLAHSLIAGIVSPAYADVAMYLALLITLVFKPAGLFGGR